MLKALIAASVRHRFLVVLITLVLVMAGVYVLRSTPVDAIPDLSDVQVIVYSDYAGQAPQVVEDQVTYPLTTRLLSVPQAKTVRGYSFFGSSFVYVIFEDGTDLYWARARVLEALNTAAGQLPDGVVPSLGPDASGVGWVYQYELTSDQHDLQQLRSIQDWFLRYELTAVEGVSEVASIGGYVKQYQVRVDPNRLRGYGLTLAEVRRAIAASNEDVGARLLEMGETEFMVRGLGYIRSVADLEAIPLREVGGRYVLLGDVARIQIGPELRRGVSESNGDGETVGGIIVMRSGENALATIERVKQRLTELQAGLPQGVTIHPVYDRSALIERAIDHLSYKLIEECVVVALVIVLFLFHLPSAAVVVLTLPVAILMAFLIMNGQGINANIMSLGGIAIAIGAMVDASIIMIENAHKHLEHPSGDEPHHQVILRAAQEVGPTLFFSLAVITLSFLPIFSLTDQAGRLFKPLAYTKTYAMASAAILAVTLVPALMVWFVRGRIRPEQANPLNRLLTRLYHPLVDLVLRWRKTTLLVTLVLVLSSIYPLSHLGSEFMPPLDEGDLLYMPTTLPGLSTDKARELLQQTDKIIAAFPEVDNVFGKAGRAETATDPAPLSMLETTIQLKDQRYWRRITVGRFYSDWPEVLQKPLRTLWPDQRPITRKELVTLLNQAIQFPGLTNAWTMPIRTRIDMLSTGIKTPVGIKVQGNNLETLNQVGQQLEAVVGQLPNTLSVYAERVMGGRYVDIDIDRLAAARHGLTVGAVQDVIQTAIGGMTVTRTVEGAERYPVNVRYARDYRSDLDALHQVRLAAPSGRSVPLKEVAQVSVKSGPAAIKSENARKTLWVYVDLNTDDVGGYVQRAKQAVAEQVQLPAGVSLVWSGQFEYMEQTRSRLLMIVPLTLVVIFILIYASTRCAIKTAIVFLAMPFSLVGAFWCLYALDYNLSVAVWVGLIALAGLDAETGVIMMLYLSMAEDQWRDEGRLVNRHDLKLAIFDGAVKRIRPKVMTVGTVILGLAPIMWSHGTGSEIMKRIAAPMVAGVTTSAIMELLVYPVIWYVWKSRDLAESTKQPNDFSQQTNE
nr:CusA/CzcA family heavy metal efflux RND transporter [uncultured Desulfuromonas sp.]